MKDAREIAREGRICLKCGEFKAADRFYIKRKDRGDLQSWCKPCYNARLSKNRDSDEWRKTRRQYVSARRGLEVNRARERRHVAKYRARYPEKEAAKRAVHLALESGALTRPILCQGCGHQPAPRRDGRTGIHAHHDNYARPLEVKWLCVLCHAAAHRALPLGDSPEGGA